ncbi:MAG: bifunctional ornithine acetyltransferase/N-acetylglutamate synthase, partial [Candidatus Hydrothermarchaeales archaeon]
MGGKKGEKYGVAIAVSEEKAACSLMVTSNRIRAAPLELSIENAKDKIARGVVITSGNANAFTGEQGRKDAERICELVSASFRMRKGDVIVNSTGIIGQRLDIDEIEGLIRSAAKDMQSNDTGITNAANAMMTTDAFQKVASRTVKTGGKDVKITGIAKGAGMIAPDLV